MRFLRKKRVASRFFTAEKDMKNEMTYQELIDCLHNEVVELYSSGNKRYTEIIEIQKQVMDLQRSLNIISYIAWFTFTSTVITIIIRVFTK